MTGHTPTPWKAFANPMRDGYSFIGTLSGRDEVQHTMPPSTRWRPDEAICQGHFTDANAALIVKAVNSHATLTALLERAEKGLAGLLETAEHNGEYDNCVECNAVREARALLATIRETKG